MYSSMRFNALLKKEMGNQSCAPNVSLNTFCVKIIAKTNIERNIHNCFTIVVVCAASSSRQVSLLFEFVNRRTNIYTRTFENRDRQYLYIRRYVSMMKIEMHIWARRMFHSFSETIGIIFYLFFCQMMKMKHHISSITIETRRLKSPFIFSQMATRKTKLYCAILNCPNHAGSDSEIMFR